MNHTPGPWEWDGDASNEDRAFRDQEAPWLRREEGRGLEVVISGDVIVKNKADMALIAAAPELLEACKWAIDAGCVVNPVICEKMEAAIAKAKGLVA